MMRMLRAMVMGAAVLMALPWSANAEEAAAQATANPKFYGTLGAIWSVDAFDVPAQASTENSWGLDTRFGYHFYENLMAEFQYQWAARYESSLNAVQLQTAETHAATANIKAGFFTTPFQPYLLFGMGIVHGKLSPGGDATDFGLRVGGGVQWFVTQNVGFYGEVTYLKAFGSLNDIDAVPVAFGPAFRF